MYLVFEISLTIVKTTCMTNIGKLNRKLYVGVVTWQGVGLNSC